MAHDVFVSHSTRNKSVADAVCAALEHGGIRCWVAPRDVLPGRSFAGEITRAINQSKAMVLIFSAESNNSEQILREVQLATNAHLHIIQFRIEDVTLNDDLQYYLSTPHWLDAMTPPLESHLERLEASLKILLGPGADKTPTSAPEIPSPVVLPAIGRAVKDNQDSSAVAAAASGIIPETPARLTLPVLTSTAKTSDKAVDDKARPLTDTPPSSATVPPRSLADEEPGPVAIVARRRRRVVLIGVAGVVVFLIGAWAFLMLGTGTRPKSASAPQPIQELSPSPPSKAPPIETAQSVAPLPSVQGTPATRAQYSGKDPGISFVNMNRIFKEYSKTKDAEKKINEDRDVAKKEYDDRANLYKKDLAEISRLDQTLADDRLSAAARQRTSREREGRIAALHKMEKEINEFRAAREKQLQEQAGKIRASLVDEMMAAIRQLTGAGDSAVFDNSGMSANGVPLILFSPTDADRSDHVVAKLNQDRVSPFLSSHALRFATVDMNLIFKSYSKTKEAEARINEARTAAKKEYDDRAETYKKALEEINLLNKALESNNLSTESKAQKARGRDAKIRAIKLMEREITEFRTTREKQLQEQSLRMRTDIVSEINRAIAAKLPSKDSSVIIDKSGMTADGLPILVYSGALPDLSQMIIDTLNQSTSTRGARGNEPLFSSSGQTRFAWVDLDRVFKALPEATAKSATENKTDAKEAALRKREAVLARVQKYLNSSAERNGIGVIFNASGNSTNGIPILVLARELPDLTDDVIAQVR